MADKTPVDEESPVEPRKRNQFEEVADRMGTDMDESNELFRRLIRLNMEDKLRGRKNGWDKQEDKG